MAELGTYKNSFPHAKLTRSPEGVPPPATCELP